MTIEELLPHVFIEDCHISGEHDPTHTPERVCAQQLADLGKRVLQALFGYDIVKIEQAWRTYLDCPPHFKNKRKAEYKRVLKAEEAKIPRRLNRGGWHAYFQDHNKKRARALEQWEAVNPAPEAPCTT